jgi:hypothetical protein
MEERKRAAGGQRERWREIGKIFSSCTYSGGERANLLLYTTKAAPGIWIGHLPARAEKKALRVHEGEVLKFYSFFGAYWYARGAMLYPFHCRLLPRAGIFSFYFIALYMQVRIRCIGSGILVPELYISPTNTTKFTIYEVVCNLHRLEIIMINKE